MKQQIKNSVFYRKALFTKDISGEKTMIIPLPLRGRYRIEIIPVVSIFNDNLNIHNIFELYSEVVNNSNAEYRINDKKSKLLDSFNLEINNIKFHSRDTSAIIDINSEIPPTIYLSFTINGLNMNETLKKSIMLISVIIQGFYLTGGHNE